MLTLLGMYPKQCWIAWFDGNDVRQHISGFSKQHGYNDDDNDGDIVFLIEDCPGKPVKSPREWVRSD